jgi:hypothetical protein
MTNTHKFETRADASKGQLSEAQLDTASGGALNVGHTIVSPRDPASGLPTGKRMHKPFVIC